MTVIILIMMIFFIGVSYGRSLNSKSESNQAEYIKYLESESKMCLENRYELKDLGKEKYEFNNIGIYSPLFDGLELNRKEIAYKRSIVSNYSLEFNNTTVNIWILSKPSEYLSALPRDLTTTNNTDSTFDYKDFPIPDLTNSDRVIYDNYFILSRLSNNMPGKTVFTNKNGIKMNQNNQNCPSSACLIKLSFHQYLSSIRKQTYIELTARDYSSTYNFYTVLNELKKTANTISLSNN